MKDLIVLLEDIRKSAKDLHYTASGQCFYGNHLLADFVFDPIDDFVDRVKEVCFLGKEIEPTITGVSTHKNDLSTVINTAIYTIEELSKTDLMQGELNILGDISEHLMKCKGLLWRQSIEEVG